MSFPERDLNPRIPARVMTISGRFDGAGVSVLDAVLILLGKLYVLFKKFRA